jgi:hypothetical protein
MCVKCRCFLLITLVQPYHCYYNMHIIIFLHLLSTNHKCVLILVISPLLLKTCCSEDGDGMEFFDKEFWACAAPITYSCGLWSLPLFLLS